MHFLKAIALVMWFLIAAFSKKAGKGVQYSSVFIKGSASETRFCGVLIRTLGRLYGSYIRAFFLIFINLKAYLGIFSDGAGAISKNLYNRSIAARTTSHPRSPTGPSPSEQG